LKESRHEDYQILIFGGILHFNENALQLVSGNDPCLDECGRSFGHVHSMIRLLSPRVNGRLMNIQIRSAGVTE